MSAWQKPNTLPHPKEAGLFWGAIRVSTLGGPLKWEVHLLCLDDETHDVHVSYDHGWRWADYDLWMPCTVPAAPDQPQAREEAQPVAYRQRLEAAGGPHIWQHYPLYSGWTVERLRAASEGWVVEALYTTPPAPEVEKLRELDELVSACEAEFCSDGTEGASFTYGEPDDADVSYPKSKITFGHIRRARQALAALQQEGRS